MAALSLKEFYHRYGTGVPNSWEQCEQIWNAATEYAVENCHSTQQLKAEILPLLIRALDEGTVSIETNDIRGYVKEAVAKLSAV